MSGKTKTKEKRNQNLLSRVIPSQLEKFMIAALAKLKNIWKYENALSGIQFYGDLDD